MDFGGGQGTVTNSFWNTQTSGQAASAGGTGLTTVQMKQFSSYAAWNAVSPNTISATGSSSAVWRIYEGQTAPLLRNFLTPLTLANTTVTYDGVAHTGTGAASLGGSLGSIATGTSAGTYNAYSTQIGYDISGGSLTIAQRTLTISFGSVSKTYDGTTTASLGAATFGNYVNTDNTNLGVTGSAAYDTRHVGATKAVGYTGLTLTGSAAGNYSLPATATGSGAITQRSSVAWTGTANDGLWSNPANWGGILPDGGNVAHVILNGAAVTFDGANNANAASGGFLGSASLQTLSGGNAQGVTGGTLNVSGGTLDIANALRAANYHQTGGIVTGDGSVSIGNAFSKIAGTFTPRGLVSIDQIAGDIVFNNEAPITFGAVTAHSGNIDITNLGGIITTALMSATGHANLTAHSPITIGSGGLTAGSGIQLTATDPSAGSTINIGGNLVSTTGAVSASAYNNVSLSSGTQISGGSITVSSSTGSVMLDPTATVSVSGGGTVQLSGTSVSYNTSSISGATPTVAIVSSGTTTTTTATTDTTTAAQTAATTAVQSSATTTTNTSTSNTSTTTTVSTVSSGDSTQTSSAGTTVATATTSTGTATSSTTSDKTDSQPVAKPVIQLVTIANTSIQKPVEQLVQIERPRGRALVCR